MNSRTFKILFYAGLVIASAYGLVRILIDGSYQFRSLEYTRAENPFSYYFTISLLLLFIIGGFFLARSEITENKNTKK